MILKQKIAILVTLILLITPQHPVYAEASMSLQSVANPILLDLHNPTSPLQVKAEVQTFDTAVLQPLREKQAAEAKAAQEAADAAQRAIVAAQQAAQAAFNARYNTYYADTYAFGNCTYYVAAKRGVPNWWGNADTWAYYASTEGWTVSNTPVVGAIAQTSAGYFGHVAFVEAVNGPTVTVSEMNAYAGFDAVDVMTYPVSAFVYLY